MNKHSTFFVLNGLVNGDAGLIAQRSGTGNSLSDGWYVLEEGDADPCLGPYKSRDVAEYAITDRESDRLDEHMRNGLGLLVEEALKMGYSNSDILAALRAGLEEMREELFPK